MSDSFDENNPLVERLDRIEVRLGAIEDSGRERLETLVERTLAPRVEELRLRLHADMVESMETRLTTFEQSIDSKVSTRVAALEKALIDQSAIITALSHRAVEAEENFQRLIAAVERLCAQRERVTPFEEQLGEAFDRQPVSDFRPRIVTEEEAREHRHRRPMSRL